MAGRIEWYGNRVFTLATAANVRAMHKAALLVASDVKKNFTLQGTGRQYYIGRSKKTGRRAWYTTPGKGRKEHRASKPGKSPAIDVGTLRASIMSEIEVSGLSVDGRVGPDIEKIAAKAPVGTDVNYGYYLEIGTSKMAPRPFLRPALRRTRKKVVKIFRDANR